MLCHRVSSSQSFEGLWYLRLQGEAGQVKLFVSVGECIEIFPTIRNYLHSGTVLYMGIGGLNVGQEVNS